MNPNNTPPTKPGFCWWRPKPDFEWTMLRLYGGAGSSIRAVQDIVNGEYLGESTSVMAQVYPRSEWVRVLAPGEKGEQ